MKPLVILTGPTAVGKTALSVKLAKLINGEIISADSMQVYKGMDIGSAKVTASEMEGVPHYLIDKYEICDDFNVFEFQHAAKEAMELIYKNGHIPIITGGTGFYIQALLKDIDFTTTYTDDAYRKELYHIADTEGAAVLHKMLLKVDPAAAAEIHENNIIKTIRAIEFYHSSGQKISEHNEQEKQRISPYNFAYFVLVRDKENLYKRINDRVDKMIDDGLVDEVKALKNAGAKADMVSMQGLGYKEILSYLNGEISLENAVENIKTGTRHYAKRQLTWFKREKEVIYLDADTLSQQDILQKIHEVLTEKEIIPKV